MIIPSIRLVTKAVRQRSITTIGSSKSIICGTSHFLEQLSNVSKGSWCAVASSSTSASAFLLSKKAAPFSSSSSYSSSSRRQSQAQDRGSENRTKEEIVEVTKPSENKNEDDDEKKDDEEKPLTYDSAGIDSYTRKLMQNRHQGIQMNPNSISQHVLPNEYIVKTNPKTGDKKMVGLERSMGYFWDLKDLNQTNEKPILSNEELIPVDIAQVVPPLHGNLQSLDEDVTGVELPSFLTKNNRSEDPSAECTLLLVCFNEYGNKMLPSWADPYEKAFSKDYNRIKTVWLSLNEGRVLNFLSSIIMNSSKNIVPDYRKKNYLMYFGNDCNDFRDILRMHNRKTGYAFLLDGIGRVRFAGSGTACEEDVKRIVSFTKALAPGLKADKGRLKKR